MGGVRASVCVCAGGEGKGSCEGICEEGVTDCENCNIDGIHGAVSFEKWLPYCNRSKHFLSCLDLCRDLLILITWSQGLYHTFVRTGN